MEIFDNTICINRGNRLLFDYSIDNDGEDYIFTSSDVITFSIYRNSELNKEPILNKDFTPKEGDVSITIDIPGDEMSIGEPLNVPDEYWYQFRLNGEIIQGYDRFGPKKLWLYPEGMEVPKVMEDGE